MIYRPYNPDKDAKAAIRIWYECGWLKAEEKPETYEAFQRFIACGSADVAEWKGEAECLVLRSPGTIRMLDTELPFSAITAVTVSRLLRKQGTAGTLLARSIAGAAEEGNAVTALGIFDQGFYDKFGFGNFPYVHSVSLDPASLNVPKLKRRPIRLGPADEARIFQNIQERRPCHGMVRLTKQDLFGIDLLLPADGFGLGFVNNRNELTHHFWAEPRGENGPYKILWMAYRDYNGFIELLSTIRSLEEQVFSVTMDEPQGIQIQDFISRPFRNREKTTGGDYKGDIEASSWKQARILDLPQVLSPLKLPVGEISFNLVLTDPIVRYLPGDIKWKGIGGNWIIKLSESGSTARKGEQAGLPEMSASVNACTRLIFGVIPASGLAASDRLSAPPELLARIDQLLRLPRPNMVQNL